MKTPYQLFGLLGLMALSNVTNAVDLNLGKTIPSTSQVIEALHPEANSAVTEPAARGDPGDYEGDVIKCTKTDHCRGLGMGELSYDKQKTKTSKRPHEYKPSSETAMSMEIIFGYKSAELTGAGKDQLKPVGEALASEKLHNLNFVVEGYTDGVGGYAYNKELSEERAISVKRFLVDSYHIEPSHIQIIGKGKSNLLDPNNPESEVNRRVRIVATK